MRTLIVALILGLASAAAAQDSDLLEAAGESDAPRAQTFDRAHLRVMRFGPLEVDRNGHTLQLLIVSQRLRAEFDRPKLPHRSFVPELQRSSASRAF